MEPTESTPTTDSRESTPPRPSPSGSQRHLPRLLVWIVAAAAVARVVTLFANRGHVGDEGAGRVQWAAIDGAARAATRERKLILYDFTAAWCPPCKRLDVEGWTDDRVAAIVNGSYVPVRIVDRQREDGKNPDAIEELQRKYRIEAFPTLVAASGEGAEIGRFEGYRGREALVRFLQKPQSDPAATPADEPSGR